MAATMDIQAREELYVEIARAKESETKLRFEIEDLKKELAEFVTSITTETDDAPTHGSDNLITSGAVYDALMSLSKRIDLIK